MSWGTELWVCQSHSNCVCEHLLALFAACVDTDTAASFGKSSGRKVPCYLLALCER